MRLATILIAFAVAMMPVGSDPAAAPAGESVAGPSAGPPAHPQAGAPSRLKLVLPAGGVEADGLDPELRDAIPRLLAAALETSPAYRVVAVAAGGDYETTARVSGKGPWRLAVRLEPLAAKGKSSRFSTAKHPFTGRADLSRAIDDVVAEIDAKLRGGAATGAAPLPLASALSAFPKAVDAYLSAQAALLSGDPGAAFGALGDALAADPSFCRAHLERAWLYQTARLGGAPAEAFSGSPATVSCAEPGAAQAARGFDRLQHGDAEGALSAATEAERDAPHSRWVPVIRGLALAALGRAAEAVDDWRAVAETSPADPRAQMWLGVSLAATGDLSQAADALGRARDRWPALLTAYTLQAEAQARLRQTEQARATLEAMKVAMTTRAMTADADQRNPELMLGSVDLLEGGTVAALKRFESTLDTLEGQGAPPDVVATLHRAVIEMRRDLILSTDPVTRKREILDAKEAIDRYQSSQPPERRLSAPWELLRLRGLVLVREGNTTEAWKIVEEIKSHATEPGYSEYYEAYLSAAILLKEADDAGSTAQFVRAAKASDRVVDLIDLAQMFGGIGKYEESRSTYESIARRLERLLLSPGPVPSPGGDMILLDPHLAAMVPIYHYTWARLGYETGNATESRQQFNYMLKYLRNPDPELRPLVKEANDRGAQAE